MTRIHRLISRSALPGLYALALVLIACAVDDSPTGPSRAVRRLLTGCNWSIPGPAGIPDDTLGGLDYNEVGEGEIFGSFYANGERLCEGLDSVKLQRMSTGTGVPKGALMPSSDYPVMWEWWDNHGNDGPCALSPLPSETNHHASSGDEGHCVDAGTYQYTGTRRGAGPVSFLVDYMRGTHSALLPGGAQVQFYPLEPQTTLQGFDIVINTDLGDSTYTDDPILAIDTVAALLNDSAFTALANPQASTSAWWRFDVHSATTDWNTPTGDPLRGRGRMLVKLWRRDSLYNGSWGDWSKLGNYWDPGFGFGGPITGRVMQLAPSVACTVTGSTTRVIQVGLEVMRPDEAPASGPSDAGRYRRILLNQNCSEVHHVVLAPVFDTVYVGDVSGRLGATAYNSGNILLTGVSFSWSSLDPTKATVNGAGEVTGVAPTTSVGIVATASGKSDTSFVTVLPLSLDHIQISDADSAVTVAVGDSVQITGYPKNQAGGTYSTTLNWGTNNAGIASVNPSTGASSWIKGESVGTTTVSVYSGAVSTPIAVTVTEPPEPVITSFSCTNDPIEENGHSYNRLYGHWTLAGSSTGVAWQTQVTASTTPPSWGSYPNYLATGTSGTTGWLGQYRNDVAGPNHLYFWVKYSPNSTWEMLGPIDTTDPEACIAFEEEFTFPKALSTMMR